MKRPFSVWWLIVLAPVLVGAGNGDFERRDQQTNTCAVARELALKGVGLFDFQPKKGLDALRRARGICPTDVSVAFNLGLAYYQMGKLPAARRVWERTHKMFPGHMKTHANLAWLRFEMGDDVDAHVLAFNGFIKHPGNLALAHTKLFALFRLGRYLEAYDWLTREKLAGIRPEQWKRQAAEYVVETVWRRFRAGEPMEAVRQAVNLLVKEYPRQPAFLKAKDQVVLAYVDKDAEIPYEMPLPHEFWPKTGELDSRNAVLDDTIWILPEIAAWKKRDNAYAVIAGISRYKRLRSKHFADRDARNFHRLLTGRGLFRDDADHVRLRIDESATRESLYRDLHWLARRGALDPNAMLLFYFSGLGVSEVDADGRVVDVRLVPVEARLGALSADHTISLAWLRDKLEKLPNRDIAVILDSCFNSGESCAVAAGEGAPVAPPAAFFSSGKGWGIAALEKGAVPYPPGRQGGLSYFLLKGLLGEADGRDGSEPDGWVDLLEGFAYASERLRTLQPAPDPILSAPVKMRLTKTGGER